jgi:hypothetical protein
LYSIFKKGSILKKYRVQRVNIESFDETVDDGMVTRPKNKHRTYTANDEIPVFNKQRTGCQLACYLFGNLLFGGILEELLYSGDF